MTADDYREQLLGFSDTEIITRAVAQRGSRTQEQIAQLMRLRSQLYQKYVAARHPITDDTVALVRRLADQHIPLAIVTGAQRDDIVGVQTEQPHR